MFMPDTEGSDNNKPRISGDLLLVIQVARTFASCSIYRERMLPKKMLLELESASLALTGYYKKISQESIKKRISELYPQVDFLDKQLKLGDTNKQSLTLWGELYDLERDLRQVWHDSGLQVGQGGQDDYTDY